MLGKYTVKRESLIGPENFAPNSGKQRWPPLAPIIHGTESEPYGPLTLYL